MKPLSGYEKKSRRDMILVCLIGLVGPLLVIILILANSSFLQNLELKSMDIRTRHLGPLPANKNITIIGIDDSSVESYGAWPWPRKLHARMIRKLNKLGAEYIVYDILIADPGAKPAEDQQLANAVKEAGNVIMPAGFAIKPASAAVKQKLPPHALQAIEPYLIRVKSGQESLPAPAAVKSKIPLPGITEAAAGLGHITATPDRDGVFRRVPPIIGAGERYLPALSLAAYAKARGCELEGMSRDGNELILPEGSSDKSALRMPLDNDGYLTVSWAGKWYDSFNTISARWILDPSPPPAVMAQLKKDIKDSICLVGVLYTGGGDMRPQPFEKAYPMVGLHANLINTLVSKKFLTRSGKAAAIGYALLMALFAVLLGLWGRPVPGAIVGVAIMAAYVAYSVAALHWMQRYVPLVMPEISFLTAFIAVTVFRYSRERYEARFLKKHFGNILPPPLLDELLANPDIINLQGERREITILFSDIRGFASITDRLPPDVTHNMLLEYFGAMTEIVFKHQGAIDKFMGDGLMALWGVPVHLPPEESAKKAVEAALEMQARMIELNKKWKQSDLPELMIRIGVNTGCVSVGFFGSDLRKEYTALGSDVNLAQRLEGACTPGKVMISSRTHSLLKNKFNADYLGEKELKGFQAPVEVYELEIAENNQAQHG